MKTAAKAGRCLSRYEMKRQKYSYIGYKNQALSLRTFVFVTIIKFYLRIPCRILINSFAWIFIV